jgi:hypothetical protein
VRLPPIHFDAISFWAGFILASILWLLLGRVKPLLNEIKEGMNKRQEVSKARAATGIEVHHRNAILKLAQGMHLAAPLFSLDEILLEPRLLAPPPHVEPGGPLPFEDIVTQTVPYLPSWPELAAMYNAPTISIPEALSGGIHLAIIGHPGAGKSVALAYLASLAARQDPSLGELAENMPFLIHAADLKLPLQENKGLLEPIIDAVSERAAMFDLPRLPNFVEHYFKSSRVLLLIDGLDELAPQDLQAISAYLEQLIRAYPKVRFVAAAGTEYLDGLIGLGFFPMTLMPWNPAQSLHFLDQWGQLWQRYVTVEAWTQITDPVDPILLNTWLAPDLLGLTPMELTLKVWGAYAGDGRGPTALDAIETHLRRISPPGVPVAALEVLALQASVNAQSVFDGRKAREWVKSFEPADNTREPAADDADDITSPRSGRKPSKTAAPTFGLLSKMAESGLLSSHPGGRMRFSHPVFAGYLAGRALSTYENTNQLVDQPNWTGKIMSIRYLAAHGDIGQIVDRMLEKTDPVLQRHLLLASRWLRDAPRQAPWRGKVMARLATLMQDDTLPLSLRGQVMAAFVGSGDPAAATLFRQFLQTNSSDQMRLAALGSGALKDAKAVELLGGALRLPDTFLRKAACLALVAIDTNQALEEVGAMLLYGDEDLRRSAAEALANHPGEGYEMLRDGTKMDDILIRRAVVYGLGRVRQPWADELLARVQVEDDQVLVRNLALEVVESREKAANFVPKRLTPPSQTPWLIAFAGKQGMGITPGSPATEVLLLAIKSENVEERLAALPYLRYTPSRGVFGALFHAMYGGDLETREAVFHTLWLMASTGAPLPNPNEFGVG